MHIPPGFTTVFPYIFATDAHDYLTFLTRGLGGEVMSLEATPEGAVRNAHVRFGDTTIMVSEARGNFEPSRGTYYLYVEDADAAMARAVAAGGKSLGAVAETGSRPLLSSKSQTDSSTTFHAHTAGSASTVSS